MSDFASRSFWLEADPYTASPPLAGDVTVDVAIVGGGFTGLWTAYSLLRAQPSLKVAVIDAEVVGYGASGRNAGFATTSLGATLHQFVQEFGVEPARQAHAAVARSIADIGRFCTDHGVHCDYEKNGVIGAALDDSQIARVEADARTAETLGLTNVRFVPGDELRREIQSPLYRCGLEDETGALLNPARLARGLARVVRQLTGVVYEQTRVERVEPVSDAVRVHTATGIVTADRVVLATNAYSGQFPEFRRMFIPLYSYVVLTEPLTDAQWDAVGWRRRQGLGDRRTYIHYYRPTADGRILMGGEDAPYFFGSHVDPAHDRNPAVFDRLRRDLVTIYPQLDGIRFTHAWGGPIAVTSRFLPTFGRIADGRVVYGFGYSGHGVAPSHTGGQILRDLVLDRKSELTELCLVRTPPIPFPPEPLRWMGVHVARRSLLRQDRRSKPKVDPLVVRLMMKLS